MVTRLYLPSGSFSTISPSFSSSWEETADAVRSSFFSYESDTSAATRVVTHNTATIGDVLIAQYISEPLDGYQVISGTCKGVILCRESSATNDCRSQLVIKVVSNDGSITRGVLVSEDNSGLSNEFGTTASVRRFPLNWTAPGAALNPIAAQDQDRIIIEVGVRFHTTTTGITATLNFQDVLGTADLVETEGNTTVANPWMEFSQNILFYRNCNISNETFLDGYEALPEIQIQGNLANLCGTQEASVISYFVMRGIDVDCPGPTLTYRTWTVTGEPDPTGFYYFGIKCGPTPLTDIIIIKELVI